MQNSSRHSICGLNSSHQWINATWLSLVSPSFGKTILVSVWDQSSSHFKLGFRFPHQVGDNQTYSFSGCHSVRSEFPNSDMFTAVHWRGTSAMTTLGSQSLHGTRHSVLSILNSWLLLLNLQVVEHSLSYHCLRWGFFSFSSYILRLKLSRCQKKDWKDWSVSRLEIYFVFSERSDAVNCSVIKKKILEISNNRWWVSTFFCWGNQNRNITLNFLWSKWVFILGWEVVSKFKLVVICFKCIVGGENQSRLSIGRWTQRPCFRYCLVSTQW